MVGARLFVTFTIDNEVFVIFTAWMVVNDLRFRPTSLLVESACNPPPSGTVAKFLTGRFFLGMFCSVTYGANTVPRVSTA